MALTIRHGSEFWRLHRDGAIERPGLVKPNAATWRVHGAAEYGRGGHFTRFYSLDEIFSGLEIPWKNAKGEQKTFVRDVDHGTHREWRNAHSISRAIVQQES